MYKGSVASAALLAIHLIFQISAASAQTSPGNVGMASGDVWSSREEPIYVPQEALELPDPGAPSDLEVATGDVWPSRAKEIHVPRGALAPSIVDGQASRRTSR
jgi:hypothetical protein